MKVSELRKALENTPDDAEVTIFIPENVNPNCKDDYMRYVKEAIYHRSSSISGKEFELTAGNFFSY